MSDYEALAAAAARLGITATWRDAWNRPAQAPAEAIQALALAMGFDLSTPEAIAASLRRLDAEEADIGTVPVASFDEGEAVSIPLRLPLAAAGILNWRIETEAGQVLQGEVDIADLPLDTATADTRTVTRHLVYPTGLPVGYHRLSLLGPDIPGETLLIVAPRQCFLPPGYDAGKRGWGIALQLYSLRSARNWGIGDFSDLADLARGLGPLGVATIGLNPLNALFPEQPDRISPYAPSSRRYLNPLYIDVTACPDFAEAPGAEAMAENPVALGRLQTARAAELVDYPAVSAVKHAAFRLMWHSFRANHLDNPDSSHGEAFRRFREAGGADLEAFGRFEAMQHVLGPEHGAWMTWPEELRRPDSPAVSRFAEAHRDAVDYAQYLQWLADRQLGHAARVACTAGIGIGFYRDLAVGFDAGGFDAWVSQDLLVAGASIGAPPDVLNQMGQDWGLAALSPNALRRDGYAAFIKAIRANMRHAGALRIDHVMVLRQLYLVPAGFDAREGAYVRYPFEDLLRIVALESVRNECLVIGEDLGTVPAGFREKLAEARVLSYKVLPFERWDNGMFKAPEAYPRLSVASVGTHDLATLKGSWLARDIDWRRMLDLYPNEEAHRREQTGRLQEREDMLNAFSHYGTLSAEQRHHLLPHREEPVFDFALTEAAHLYLAQAPSLLMLAQLEDFLEELEGPNLPGTINEHPNWRRRLPETVAEIIADPRVTGLAAKLTAARDTA